MIDDRIRYPIECQRRTSQLIGRVRTCVARPISRRRTWSLGHSEDSAHMPTSTAHARCNTIKGHPARRYLPWQTAPQLNRRWIRMSLATGRLCTERSLNAGIWLPRPIILDFEHLSATKQEEERVGRGLRAMFALHQAVTRTRTMNVRLVRENGNGANVQDCCTGLAMLLLPLHLWRCNRSRSPVYMVIRMYRALIRNQDPKH